MLVEGCKHEVEITVPVDEVARETDRVIATIQQKARLPGFRPGKAPVSLIRAKFSRQVREDVLENLLPKFFKKKMEEEELHPATTPRATAAKTATPVRVRQWTDLFMCSAFWLTASD